MPVDGGARGPGHNSNVRKEKHFKRDGPSSNIQDGPSSGGEGHLAKGMTRGIPSDMLNGSPMKGPSSAPSMGGVLKYIRERGTGVKGPSSATGPDNTGFPTGESAGHLSPYPTGGSPHKQTDQGHDIPGESHEEEEQEGGDGASCGHPGCTAHGGKSLKYSKGNKETKEPSMKGGPY
jgi:hypothetical protein